MKRVFELEFSFQRCKKSKENVEEDERKLKKSRVSDALVPTLRLIKSRVSAVS